LSTNESLYLTSGFIPDFSFIHWPAVLENQPSPFKGGAIYLDDSEGHDDLDGRYMCGEAVAHVVLYCLQLCRRVAADRGSNDG